MNDSITPQVRRCDEFWSGTGIIALALGAGMRPAEIAAQYESLVATVFPRSRRRWWRFPGRLTHPAYDASVLRRALEGVLGTRLLGDSSKRLVIPSWDVHNGSVHMFKTPHHDRLRRDWKIPMVDVAMATSAAPAYFAAAHVDGHRLVDGGVWANNPSVVGITEAVSMLGVPLAAVAVLNIGTMDQVSHHPAGSTPAAWPPGPAHAVPLVLTAGSRGAQGIAEHLVGKHNYSRFDAIVPGGLYALDDADPDDLAAYAASASRNLSPVFTARFAAHRAPAYKPPAWAQQAPGSQPGTHRADQPPDQETPTMQLADHFDVLLKDTVNLSQFRLDTLDSRVTAIYTALKADPELGPYVRGKIPQGSWAHRTIINPVGDKEFDADFMLLLEENPDWSGQPEDLHRAGLPGAGPAQHLRRHAALAQVPLRPADLRQLLSRRHRPLPQAGRRAPGDREPRQRRVGGHQSRRASPRGCGRRTRSPAATCAG